MGKIKRIKDNNKCQRTEALIQLAHQSRPHHIYSMSERTFCNCHGSRQVPYLRHCWNRIVFIIIRVLVVINQIVILSPFVYVKNSKKNSISVVSQTTVNLATSDCYVKWKFRTQKLLTAVAIVLIIFYAAVSPLMVLMGSRVYGRRKDNIFHTVGIFSLIIDVLCGLLILANNIWHREKVVEILNNFNEILARFECLETNLIGFTTFLAIKLKMFLVAHDMISSYFFIIEVAPSCATESVAGYVFCHLMRSLGGIFELSMFVFLSLFLSCSQQLEKELQGSPAGSINDSRMLQVIRLQDALQRVVALLRSTFQFGIFAMIFLYFVTILFDIYAMLDFYVIVGRIYSAIIMSVFSLALQLYSLIYVAHLWQFSQRKVKDLFLQREEFYCVQVLPI